MNNLPNKKTQTSGTTTRASTSTTIVSTVPNKKRKSPTKNNTNVDTVETNGGTTVYGNISTVKTVTKKEKAGRIVWIEYCLKKVKIEYEEDDDH
jgi:hypothetical protein